MEDNTSKVFSQPSGQQQQLPNATVSLVLGILSILGCCIYAIPGTILSIITIVLAIKDEKLYRLNPGMYTVGSYNNTRAGKICAIVGLSLSCLYLVAIIAVIAIVGIAAIGNPQAMQDALRNLQH